MADKSLFDIAKELYQGFGNNPANRELANTLTFRAPVVRELNPLVTIPRGIETLRNTDYNALKDFLTGKYQIAQDPKASLQRAGQSLMNVGEGALDAAPVLGAIKPTIAGAKVAAPYFAEAGARKLASLEEKYGLPTSLQMNVVKPEGNLNFAPRIKEQLKGPEKQTATSFIGQMKNMPGGSEQSLKEMVERIGDPTTVMTKEQFENSLNPSRYDKIDMTEYSGSNVDDLIEHFMDNAFDYADESDIMHNLGVADQHQELVHGLMYGDLNYSELTARDKEAFRQYAGVTEQDLANELNPDSYFARRMDDAYRQSHHDVAYELARSAAEDDIIDNGGDLLHSGQPKWDRYQRLVPMDQEGYFEIGVMHPEYQGEYRHYSGAPKGTIGHVRGTLTEEPTIITGGVEVPNNTYVIEEIQSDAQQSSAQKGPLRQVHGVLFKSAVQDAIEKGADRIYLPTSEAIVRPITGDRGEKSLDLYKRVYDKEVKQQGLDELASIPGVEVRPVNGLKPGTDDEVQYYYEIEMSPEAKDYLLKGEGFSTPGLGDVKVQGKLPAKAPESHPFIGYMTKDGRMERFNESQAREADYHHSNLVRDLDAYDSDDSLKFVRNNSENAYTIRGNAAIKPHSTESKEQLSALARQLVDSGADPSAPFQIEHMSLPETEAPYQGKSIGTLKDWIEGTHGFAAGGLVSADYDEEHIDKLADSIFETAPSEGGVSYRDYPNPYGLRAYRNKDGSYGGEMLPKAEGWAGEQRGRGNLKGSTVTEYSMDDERGSFPSINPLLSLDEIDAVAAGNMTPEIYKKAVEWRDLQARHGESAFKNPTGFAKGGNVNKDKIDKLAAEYFKKDPTFAKRVSEINYDLDKNGKYSPSKYGMNITSMPGNYTLGVDPNIIRTGQMSPSDVAVTTTSRNPFSKPVQEMVFNISRGDQALPTLAHEASHAWDATNRSWLKKRGLSEKEANAAVQRYMSVAPKLKAAGDLYADYTFDDQATEDEVVAKLRAYESILPAGAKIFQTKLGKQVFPTDEAKAWWLSRTQPSMSDQNYIEWATKQAKEGKYAEGGAVNTDISKYYTNASMPGLADLQAKYYTSPIALASSFSGDKTSMPVVSTPIAKASNFSIAPMSTSIAPMSLSIPAMNSYSSTPMNSYSSTINTPIAQPDLTQYGISANQLQQLSSLADSSNWLQNYNQAKPVTVNPDLNQLAEYYKEQSAVPKPVAPVVQQATAPAAMPTVQSVTKAPMYTKHEGMLFGDDFYDRYAQNVGGQFADPYHNFLMTQARIFGPDSDLPNLYKQYQASGRTDTPDWATLDTTNPISKLPLYAHNWDASGANPVDNLSWAWNSTTPLVEGITVPEGYWDAVLAYNMNLSKWNPTSNTEKFDPEAYKEYNAAAYNAMAQGVYDRNSDVYQNYLSPKQQAAQTAANLAGLRQAREQYTRQKQINTDWGRERNVSVEDTNSRLDELLAEIEARFARYEAEDKARQEAALQAQINSAMYAKGGQVTAKGYAEGGLVYNDEEINNLANQLFGA